MSLWTPDTSIQAARQPAPSSGAPGAAASSPSEHKPRSPPPDLPSLLLDSRIVYLGMPLVPAVTELMIAEFMYLQYKDIQCVRAGCGVEVISSGRQGSKLGSCLTLCLKCPHRVCSISAPSPSPSLQQTHLPVHQLHRDDEG